MNCEGVVIDSARACRCFGTGMTPRLVEVVRSLDHEYVVAERDKWKITCDAHCRIIEQAEGFLRAFDGLDIVDKVEAIAQKVTELRDRADKAEDRATKAEALVGQYREAVMELQGTAHLILGSRGTLDEVLERLAYLAAFQNLDSEGQPARPSSRILADVEEERLQRNVAELRRERADWKRRAESADRGRDAAVERRREIESKLEETHAVEVEADFDLALRRAHEILAEHGLEGAESGRDLSHWTLFGALNWLNGQINQHLVELAQARAIEKRNSQRTVGVLVDWRDRARKAEHALRTIATGDVPGVSFADPDLVSEFAQDALGQLPSAGVGPGGLTSEPSDDV